jgi:hypothetical protein
LGRHKYATGPNSVDRPTCKALRDLLGILTLEHVHDDTRIEAMLFAEIDPADPVVEDICLLTDGLRDVLEPMLAEQPDIREHLQFAAKNTAGSDAASQECWQRVTKRNGFASRQEKMP